MLSRELEQATGSVRNASFLAEWVDGGGGGGGGGGDDCGDGNGESGGGEGGSGESTRASIGLICVLGVTLGGGAVCSRTKSSADSRAIQTAQHTSAKMLHRGSVSRCLGLAARGLASIPPCAPSAERVVLARTQSVGPLSAPPVFTFSSLCLSRDQTRERPANVRYAVLMQHTTKHARGRAPQHANESPPWLRPRTSLPSSRAGSLRRP